MAHCGWPAKAITDGQSVARKRGNLSSTHRKEGQESGWQLLFRCDHRWYLSGGVRAYTKCLASEVRSSLFQVGVPSYGSPSKGDSIHDPRFTCRISKVGISRKGDARERGKREATGLRQGAEKSTGPPAPHKRTGPHSTTPGHEKGVGKRRRGGGEEKGRQENNCRCGSRDRKETEGSRNRARTDADKTCHMSKQDQVETHAKAQHEDGI